MFYTLYEHTCGSWVAFTDRLLDKKLLGLQMTVGSLTFLGAFFIVGLSPLFAWLWPWLAKRGLNPGTPVKSAIGLLFAGLAFLPMLGAAQIGADGTCLSVVAGAGLSAAGDRRGLPLSDRPVGGAASYR